MRKLILLRAILFLILSFAAILQSNAQSACCPEFEMQFPKFRCQTADCHSSAIGLPGGIAVMCQYSTNTIQVLPGGTPGFTYAWVVTGGTINGNVLTNLTTTSSYINVTWGNGNLGTIQVTIYNSDSSCFKVLNQSFCLTKAPKALFVKNTGNTVCKNQPITFTNTSTGVYNHWYWNFGDGTTQTGGMTVTHSYPTAGTYIVSLTVSNASVQDNCGCSNTYYDTITVSNSTGLQILTPDCRKMFCANDTVTYCASITGCSSYTWSALGGTVIGSGSCIKVVWNLLSPSIINPTVSLTIPPSCAGSCGNTASFTEKVLYNGMPIQGNNSVCVNSSATYTLPSLPGVFYTWSVAPAAGVTVINGTNLNTPAYSLNFSIPGNYIITVSYIDSLRNCQGVSTKPVAVRPAFNIIGPTTSCVGCSSTFTTNFPASNFNWNINTTPAVSSTNTTAITNAWTPSQTGTFIVTATQTGSAYCNSPQQAVIEVAPKPVLSMAQSTNIACPGTVVKFWVTSNVAGMNINWTYPAGTQVISNNGPILDTITLSFTGTGPYNVTATQMCKYLCSQTSATATVFNPAPPVLITPKTTVCIDELVTYSVIPVPGITYTWSINNSNLGTIQSGQGTPTVQILWHGNGTNSGTLSVSNCGGTTTANITVVLPPTVSITKTGSCFSNGVGYTLTALPSGQTYSWSTGSTAQSINITSPGTYTVIVNGSSGGSCPVTKSITVLPDPYQFVIAPPCVVTNCNLSSFSIPLSQLVLNINCAATLKWYYKSTPTGSFTVIPGANGPNYNATALGCYKCVATCANGCNVTSNTICIPDDIYFCCSTSTCSGLTFGLDFTSSGCNPTTFNVTYPGTGSPTGGFPVHYCYGDGTSENLNSTTATHQYAAAGQYTVCIATKTLVFNASSGTNDTCCISRCKPVDVPVVAQINASYNCNTGILSMSDNSSYYPNNAGATYTWTVTGGTYTGTLGNSPNEAVTPTSNGSFVITLSVTNGGCTSTTSVTVPVFIPNAAFTVNPNPTCSRGITYFNTAPGYASYYWQFGDGAYSLATPSSIPPPQHQYTNNTNAPINFTATLTVTTPDGCTATSSQVVSVHPKPIVTVTPNPVSICKGGSATLTANVNPNGNGMCSSYIYQWMLNGTNISGATNVTYNATAPGLYSVLVSGSTPSCNCTMISDTAVVKLFPEPIANIETSSTICFDAAANPWNFNINATSVAGYTYNWSSNNGGITFSPNNSTSPSTTATGTLVNNSNFVIYLQVVDANGCVAVDSLCMYSFQNPNVSITSAGTLCSNTLNTLSVVAPLITNNYTWNTGASGPVITTTLAGPYNVTATNLQSGCSAFSNTIFINRSPSLELFPIGCDTICSDKNITIPLAQLPNLSNYFVQWHDGIKPAGPIIYAGNGAITIPANFLSLGLHHLWATVNFPNGCEDSSGVYDVFIKKCCVCAGSSWAFRQYSTDNGATYVNWSCSNSEVGIACNPVIINAAYNCAPNSCAGTVTGQVLDNMGNVLVNIASMPYTYTPTPGTSGVVYIKLFGWCNGIKCDSCTIPIFYNCPPQEPPCNCNKDFHFNGSPVVVTPNHDNGKAAALLSTNSAVIGGTAVSVPCGTTSTTPLYCKQNYQFYINYQNPWPSGKCQTSVLGEVLLNGNVVYSQSNVTQANPLNYVFPAAGDYCVRFKLIVNGKICDVCTICFKVACDVVCECREDFNFTGNPVIKANLQHAAYTVTPPINCNTSLAKPLMCNTSYSFYVPFNNPYTFPCVGKDSAVITKTGNAVPLAINPNTSMSNPLNYTFTQSGTYCVTHYLVVNGKVCKICRVCFTVECPTPCNCNAFDFLSDPTITFKKTAIGNTPIMGTLSSPCETSLAAQLQCKTAYNFFITAGPIGANLPNGCNYTIKATLTRNNVVIDTKNNVSPTNPLTYTFTSDGIYCIKYELYVKNVLCKTCTQCFSVKCCPPITVPPLEGNFTGCVIGGTTHIYNALGGGTFTSLDPSVATVDNNGNVTAVNYGTAIILYTYTKYPCDYYVAAEYNVPQLTPLPPITGNAAICMAGDSVKLSITGDKGYWSSSDGNVATVTPTTQPTKNTFVKGVSSGQVTITFTTVQSGCPVSATRNVAVHNIIMEPSTGPMGVCKDNSVLFQNATPIPGNFTPAWISLNNKADINSSGVVTGVNPGNAVIRYALNYADPAFGTCAVSTDRDLTVYNLPGTPGISYIINPVFVSGSNNTICNGQQFVLSGQPAGGTWSAAGSLVVDGSGRVTTVSMGTGTVTYTVFNSFGCSRSATKTYTVASCNTFSSTHPPAASVNRTVSKKNVTSTLPVNASGIVLYPNPAHTRVFFNVDGAIGKGEMIIKDAQGKELKKGTFKAGINSLEISKYAPGVYFITFNSGSDSETQKLVIH